MTKEYLEKIKDLRKLLHQHPNLSGQEGETIELLESFLQANTSLEIVDQDGWFYVVKKGREARHPIAFRADMDALPMDEGLDIDHRSLHAGVAHKCGHDGHMAALCGLALELDQRQVERTIYLVFQPAEETGQGALKCKNLIREKGISEIYAFHNLGGYPEKAVIYREGLTQPASQGLIIRFSGKQSHASAPEQGINPAPALARLVLYAQNLTAKYSSQENGMVLCTIVGLKCGEEDFGISPGQGSISLTLRSDQEPLMKKMEEELLAHASKTAEEDHLTMTYEVRDYFPETRNHHKALDRVLQVASSSHIPVIGMKDLWRASEDFGYYLKECPGSMFYIGNGEKYPPLHTRDYDFNDRILETAVDMFLGLALN